MSDKTVLGLDWQLPLLWPLQPRGQHCKDRCFKFSANNARTCGVLQHEQAAA